MRSALFQNYTGELGQELLCRKGAIEPGCRSDGTQAHRCSVVLMMGRWTTLEEVDRSLSQKVGKIISP